MPKIAADQGRKKELLQQVPANPKLNSQCPGFETEKRACLSTISY